MAIAERIISYGVRVTQTNFSPSTRLIMLRLESGTTVSVSFEPERPPVWLTFTQGAISIVMTTDQFEDVHHVLQTEDPVFCTALNLLGLQVGAVHTELDLSVGEPTGEGYQDKSLEALVVRARSLARSEVA